MATMKTTLVDVLARRMIATRRAYDATDSWITGTALVKAYNELDSVARLCGVELEVKTLIDKERANAKHP